jgi:hypothetical protein
MDPRHVSPLVPPHDPSSEIWVSIFEEINGVVVDEDDAEADLAADTREELL